MADFVGVVRKFIEHTGRYDLVVDAAGGNYTDASTGPGARHYVNQAINYLDQRQETPQQVATQVETPAAGVYFLDSLNCRSVRRVWTKPSDGDRTMLDPVPWEYMRQRYAKAASEVEKGRPLYWCLVDPRQVPAQFDATLNTVDGEHLIKGNAATKTRIMFMPPSDGTYTMLVEGLFYSHTLIADSDVNWWTQNKPWVIVYAAKFILEGALRSEDGMKAMDAFLSAFLAGIDKDLVELDLTGPMEMEG